MKARSQSRAYSCIECNYRYVAHIQHAFAELGFPVSKVVPQYSFLIGYNFRMYFAIPIPALIAEIMLEASVTNPSSVLSICDN